MDSRSANPLVGLVFAPQGAEARAVRRGIRAARAEIAVITLPIGPANAARAAAASLEGRRVERALLIGVCGAVSDGFAVGDAIVADTIVDAKGAAIDCDPELVASLRERLPDARSGCILTGERIVTHARHKRSVGERYRADAVDMEAYDVLAVLQKRGIPGAVIRVVSDTVDDDLPDLESALRADGSLNPYRLALALARAPRAGFALVRNSTAALRVVTAVTTLVLRS